LSDSEAAAADTAAARARAVTSANGERATRRLRPLHTRRSVHGPSALRVRPWC